MNWNQRLGEWFRTRPYGRLWRSLPALAAGLAGTGFGLALVCWSPVTTANHYGKVVDRSLAAHDFSTVLVASQRRLALGVTPRPEILFKMAQALSGLGQTQEAYAVMNTLARADSSGYAPAHLVIVQSLLGHPPLTAEVLKSAELHLAHAEELEPHSQVVQAIKKYLHNQFKAWEAGKTNNLNLDPKSLAAHELAGWIYYQMQDWPAAKPHLLAEAGLNPAVNFMLADLARAEGDSAGERHWNEQAKQVYRGKVLQATEDNPTDRLAWVQAEVRLGNYDAGRQILEDGQKFHGARQYPLALAELYAAWAQQFTTVEPDNLAARWQCLEKGLVYNSMNTLLLLQLAGLSRCEGPEAKAAGKALATLLSEGEEAPMRLSILGMAAWQKGDLATAEKYFTRAYGMAPTQPTVANNMALALSQGEHVNLKRAMAIVQALVDKSPEQPHYRETRGQILLLQNKLEAAAEDLEFALPRLDYPPATARALGRIYRLMAARDSNQKLMAKAARYDKIAEAAATTSP